MFSLSPSISLSLEIMTAEIVMTMICAMSPYNDFLCCTMQVDVGYVYDEPGKACLVT